MAHRSIRISLQRSSIGPDSFLVVSCSCKLFPKLKMALGCVGVLQINIPTDPPKLPVRSTYISCLFLCALDLCALDLCALDLCALDLCALDLCALDLCALDLCTLDLCALDLCALDLYVLLIYALLIYAILIYVLLFQLHGISKCLTDTGVENHNLV